MAKRLGVTTKSLCSWLKRYGEHAQQYQAQQQQDAELRQLKAELKRVTEERDILKKAATYFAKESG